LKPKDAAKWTVVTYLPFLWRPDTHMLLKPMVTTDFAERVDIALRKITKQILRSMYTRACWI